MNVSREQISTALFQLLTNNPQLAQLCNTITRVPKIWTEVPTAQIPWLCLFKGGPATEEFSQSALGLTKYIIHYNLWLYLRADLASEQQDNTTAETTINYVADAIDVVLQSTINGQILQRGQAQTLGGLVTKVSLEGGSEWGREIDDENIVVAWRIAVETGV